MDDQLSFAFGGPPLAPMFFAIVPPASVASHVVDIRERICRESRVAGRMMSRNRLHISLHGVFKRAGFPNSLIETANEAGASVSMPPFEVTFARVASFGGAGNRAIVLYALDKSDAGLMAFHRALARSMAKVGLGRCVRSGFTPHMTLFYDRDVIATRQVEPVRWIVHDFVLIQSLFGHGRHRHLARFPLQT